ncbi:hypothetical protein ABPG72_000979 [Tetrahymena utriculariae]
MKKKLILSWLTIFNCIIVAQCTSLQILPVNFQQIDSGEVSDSIFQFLIQNFPLPMQTDTYIFSIGCLDDLQKITVKLFDSNQVNNPKVQISTLDGNILNLNQTFSKNTFTFYLNDQQRQIVQNTVTQEILFTIFNVTNTANSNSTTGQQIVQLDFPQQSLSGLMNTKYLYYNINKCQLIPINLLSNRGCHILGNVTFSVDFSQNMIFTQNDSLLLTFQYQEYLEASQTLSYSPTDFYTYLKPFVNISQIQAWVQQVYANSPLQNLNVKVIDNQSILISGFQNVLINNLEGYIDQQLIITLSNLYYPPTVNSKLMFDMYLIDNLGFFKCQQQVSLIQQNTSPFQLFNVSFSSNYYGSPLTFNITIIPQRYMLSQNNTLTLTFSNNLQIPSTQNLKVTGISFFQTSNAQLSVTNNQIVFQNFLTSSISSEQQIMFSIQGFQVPLYGGNVSITAQNSYFNQYPQHQSNYTQLIYCQDLCLKLSLQNQVVQQNSSIQINFTNQYQLQNKGFINLVFPQSSFGILQNTSQPQSIKLVMNSQSFQSQISVLNNVLTIPYTYPTALPANQLIYFQLDQINNLLSTLQVQDSFEYQILDQNGQIQQRSLVQFPQSQPDLVYITAWQPLMQMQLSNTNNILLSFYVNSDTTTIDGINQNSVQIQFSTPIQFTQNSVFVFLDGFSQQKQLTWAFYNSQLNISNFTLQKQLNYTIILQNVTLSRFQSVLQTPQIQNFGKSILIHSIAQGYGPLQLNLTNPYLLKNAQLQIMNSTFINTGGNYAVIQIFLENLQILSGESVQIYIDKSCDLSMLNSLAIQSSSIPSVLTFTANQFNLDSSSNQNQNILIFQIPANLSQQLIKSDLSIQFSFINNPISLVSIQYKICFINSLGQLYASSFSLLYNDLQPLQLEATITYNGTQDSKVLGEQFQGTLEILSQINLPQNGQIKISGFGKNLLLNQQNLNVTSIKSNIQSIKYNNNSSILSFQYLNLSQNQTSLPIFINGLSTYSTSEFSFNDLKLQIFDFNQGLNLVSLIAPLNVSISNLLCNSKCVECYISSDNCVFNSTYNPNCNNSNSQQINYQNDTLSQQNCSNFSDTKDLCNIKGCAQCQQEKCNNCLQCMSGFQLNNNKCLEQQQYKLSIISVSIILSISISMGTYLLKSNTRMQYLLLVQWVCIDIYCQIEYLSQVMLNIIHHLNQNETREQVLLQIIHLVLLTFITIFYLFTQFSFLFIRNYIFQSYSKTFLQSKFSNFIKWVIISLSVIEFRIFYISFIFQNINNEDNEYSLKPSNQNQMEQSSIIQQQNTQNFQNGQNSYNQLIQNNSNAIQTLNTSNNNHKQHVIFILSGIQNLLKIVMISVDISFTNNPDKVIQLYETISVSILLLSLHVYIIIKSLNIYNDKRKIVPFQNNQNSSTLSTAQKNMAEQQNIIQKNNIHSLQKLQIQEPQIKKQEIQEQNFKYTPSQIIYNNNTQQQQGQIDQQENIQQQLQQQSPIKKQDRRKRTKFNHLILNERIQAFKND